MIRLGTYRSANRPAPDYEALTLTGNEINDIVRQAALEGDGRQPEMSYGVWQASTNALINGGFETNTTGWGTAGANTIARSTAQARFGSASCLVTYQDTINNLIERTVNILHVAVPFTVSCWVYIPSAWDGTGNINIIPTGLAGATINATQNADLTLRDQWQRIRTVYTPAAGDTSGPAFRLTGTDNPPTAGRFLYVDGCQVEVGAFPTPYVETDGGAVARAAARVQAPSAGLLERQGWVAARARVGWDSADASNVFILDWADAGPTRLVVRLDFDTINTKLQCNTGSAQTAASVSRNDIVSCMGRWDSVNCFSSFNGSAFGPSSAPRTIGVSAPLTTFGLGNWGADSALHWNGDLFWVAWGLGQPTDADATLIHSFGNHVTDLRDFPPHLRATGLWSAANGRIDSLRTGA